MALSPTSAALEARALRVLAGGATHVVRSYHPGIHVVRAQGSRKWLVDGRELVDYTMGHGALLLGHAHPAVVEAVRRQVAAGTHYGAANPLEIEWAERIAALVPAAERLRFTSSGTEATMLALRIARVVTGRQPVVKLDEHFHGWHDAVSVNLDAAGNQVAAPGVPDAVAALTRVVRADDVSVLEHALADRDVAAVILEASGAHYGQVPLRDGYVAAVRRACDATGTLLVFDEVVTGFRVAPGGMQALLGVTPDLTAFGKIMAGGLPGGAVGGRTDLMTVFDVPASTLSGGVASQRSVVHPGTYNANPLSAAAGVATLDLVADGAAQARADTFAARLEQAWQHALERTGVAGRVWRLSSLVHCALDDRAAHERLPDALRAAGVDMLRTSAICSTAHDDDDLQRTAAALERALPAAAAG